MVPRRHFRLLTFLFLLLAAFVPGYAQEAPLNGFDDYVNKALREWEVPGLAIAIIKDDRIVLAKGYGERKLGDPAPVNERTLFAIGSSSKAFTAAAIAMLVDEGKLKWDDPVTKYLQGVELYDPYVTRELTVRDLLSHRSARTRQRVGFFSTPLKRWAQLTFFRGGRNYERDDLDIDSWPTGHNRASQTDEVLLPTDSPFPRALHVAPSVLERNRTDHHFNH